MFVDLLRYIETEETIPFDRMLRAFNEAVDFFVDAATRQAANDILEGAGDYLRMYEVREFIVASISDADARQLISERKHFIEAVRHLISSILKLIGVRTDWDIRMVLMHVEDCCYEFHSIAASEHKNKINRQKYKNILELKKHISTSINTMKENIGILDTKFRDHKYEILKSSEIIYEYPPLEDADDLIVELKLFSFTIDLTILQYQTGRKELHSIDNRTYTYIVECVYSIYLEFGKPVFVTTPGSNFSLLCGLIFELATGRSEENFAGAISKFSRSDVRKVLDDHHAKYRAENMEKEASRREADNFVHARYGIEEAWKEFHSWNELASSREWNEFEREQILMRRLRAGHEALDLANANGPYPLRDPPLKKHDLYSPEMNQARTDVLARSLELRRAYEAYKAKLI